MPIPQAEQANTDMYNMVSVKNPLAEDFVFGYDNKGKYLVYKDSEGNKNRVRNPNYNTKGNYMIRAGETRRFPKFIAQVGVKHLIDKILLKQDPKGGKVGNPSERERIAKLVIMAEETFERPTLPTDTEVVEMMNTETDLDKALESNKARLREEQPDDIIPQTPEPAEESFDGLNQGQSVPATVTSVENQPTVQEHKVTAELEAKESELPSREKMVAYAVHTLNMDPETVIRADGPNNGKSYAEVWDSMSDQELFDELQLGEGDLVDG